MKKIIKHSSYATIILAFVCLLTVIYWNVSPVRVIEFNQPKATIFPLEITPGGRAIVIIDYCKNKDIAGSIDKDLTLADNSYTIELGNTPSHFTPGCKTIEMPIKIPDTVTPGQYYLTFNFNYDVNPIRHDSIDYTSEVFDIVSK